MGTTGRRGGLGGARGTRAAAVKAVADERLAGQRLGSRRRGSRAARGGGLAEAVTRRGATVVAGHGEEEGRWR